MLVNHYVEKGQLHWKKGGLLNSRKRRKKCRKLESERESCRRAWTTRARNGKKRVAGSSNYVIQNPRRGKGRTEEFLREKVVPSTQLRILTYVKEETKTSQRRAVAEEVER